MLYSLFFFLHLSFFNPLGDVKRRTFDGALGFIQSWFDIINFLFDIIEKRKFRKFVMRTEDIDRTSEMIINWKILPILHHHVKTDS